MARSSGERRLAFARGNHKSGGTPVERMAGPRSNKFDTLNRTVDDRFRERDRAQARQIYLKEPPR